MDREDNQNSASLDLRKLPCTVSMLTAIWLVFAVELHFHALGNQAMLLRLGALPMNAMQRGEPWRLLTYALLHSAWWHIGLNTLLLLVAGPVVERALGSWFTLFIAVLGAALGGAAILLVHHGHGPTVELGASGAFFALLAAALVVSWRPRPAKPSPTYRVLRTYVLAGFAISFLPGISMAAHVAGAAAGAVLSWMKQRAKTTSNELYGGRKDQELELPNQAP
jgi:membrane associated rhomboid family serine protease